MRILTKISFCLVCLLSSCYYNPILTGKDVNYDTTPFSAHSLQYEVRSDYTKIVGDCFSVKQPEVVKKFNSRSVEIVPDLTQTIAKIGKKEGQVVFVTCINPEGIVVMSALKKSDFKEPWIDNLLLQKSLNYQYNKSDEAPCLECAEFYFKLDIE